MSLRFEIFPAELDRTVDFYGQVLGFVLERDDRSTADPYVTMRRDEVRIGAAPGPNDFERRYRRPPRGVEIVLEVDDLDAERARVAKAGWPVDDDLQEQPWGAIDFRVLDPDGYYLRITSRE